MADCHITAKELVPITIAAVVWGRGWQGKVVRAWCDNEAVVCIVNQGTSRDPEVMHLVRCLAFVKARFQFKLVASHIRGSSNIKADALSRNNLQLFQSLHPQAAAEPTQIPEEVLDLLLVSKPDWMSGRWSSLWSSISPMD